MNKGNVEQAKAIITLRSRKVIVNNITYPFVKSDEDKVEGEQEDKKEKKVDENKSENEELLDDVKFQEKIIEKETKGEELSE